MSSQRDQKLGLICRTTIAALPVVLPSDDSRKSPREALVAKSKSRRVGSEYVLVWHVFRMLMASKAPTAELCTTADAKGESITRSCDTSNALGVARRACIIISRNRTENIDWRRR